MARHNFLRSVGVNVWAVSSVLALAYTAGWGGKPSIELLLFGVWMFQIAIGAMLAALLFKE